MGDDRGCYGPSDMGFSGDVPQDRNGGEGTGASTIIESTNTEWTNEKHSMYLNSIEESFVNQLYNRDYQDPHSWLMKTQRGSNSLGSNFKNMCFDQFKVQRKGRWEELKFGRSRTQTDIVNDSRALSSNPWIQHFRPANSECQRHEPSGHGASSSSMLLPTCSQDAYNLESFDSSAEVSDQNFTDNDWERERQMSRTSRKRRTMNIVKD